VLEYKRPDNDLCEDAFVVNGSTVNATFISTSYSDIQMNGPMVWYSILGTGTGIRVSTCTPETDYDTALFVVDGCGPLDFVDGLANLVDSECNGFGSTVELETVEDTNYVVAVSGSTMNDSGTFGLSLKRHDGPVSPTTATRSARQGS